MKLTSLILATAAAATLLITTSAQAQTIAAWTFENDAGTPNNTPATSSGIGTADAIGMGLYPTPANGSNYDDVSQGKSSDTGANGVANTTYQWRIRAQLNGNSGANGWSSAAPIESQGAQFFASTAGVTSGAIKISFDWYATTQGEANLEALYTTNGGSTWTNLPLTLGGSDSGLAVLTGSNSDTNTTSGSYLSDNLLTNGSKAGQDWFTGLTATITNPSVLNDSGFGIELVNASTGTDDVSTQGTALNNTSGNWRFDNVSIAAVPEPSSWLLGLCAGSFLAGFGLLRLKNSAKCA